MQTHDLAAALQGLLSLSALAGCWRLIRRNQKAEHALAEQRRLTGQSRTPALTRVLPSLAPRAREPLPRFKLTHFDGRIDPDGVQRTPPLPF